MARLVLAAAHESHNDALGASVTRPFDFGLVALLVRVAEHHRWQLSEDLEGHPR